MSEYAQRRLEVINTDAAWQNAVLQMLLPLGSFYD
jgi:hypothetical protein